MGKARKYHRMITDNNAFSRSVHSGRINTLILLSLSGLYNTQMSMIRILFEEFQKVSCFGPLELIATTGCINLYQIIRKLMHGLNECEIERHRANLQKRGWRRE